MKRRGEFIKYSSTQNQLGILYDVHRQRKYGVARKSKTTSTHIVAKNIEADDIDQPFKPARRRMRCHQKSARVSELMHVFFFFWSRALKHAC